MLRPDDDRQLLLPFAGLVPSGCDQPAGESPVPVSAGAPGSRPQAGGETRQARAGCRKPLRREQPRGPQRHVNAAASSELQRESRAGHVAAKATSVDPEPERATDLPGVWAVARVEGWSRNRRDPSARPLSGRGEPYKPSVKSATVQRESEGIIVPMRPVQQNAGRGKGPCGGRVGSGGKRTGMSGHKIRSNHPAGRQSGAKAQRLRRRLWAAAKQPPLSGGSAMRQPKRPSVSRVRENRTHGSEGGLLVTSPCRGSGEVYQ